MIKLIKRYTIFIVAILVRKYLMSNKGKSKNKSSWLLPASLGMVLLIGIVTSLIQMRQTSNMRTKANNLTIDKNDCSVPADQLQISPEEQKMLNQINAHRVQYGLNNLVWSDALIKAAKWMSRDMLANQYLGHTDSLGRDVKTRVADCGYAAFISPGENIDNGDKNSTTIIEAWKHSPPQNANLLNKNFKEAGIALASDPASGSYYWTLNLGNSAPSPIPSDAVTITPTPLLSPILITTSPTPGIIISHAPTLAHPSPSPLPTKRFTPTATPKLTLTPTPIVVPGFTPNPLDMQVYVTAKIIGIGDGGNRNPKHFTRYVTVGIYNMKNVLIKEGNGYIIYDRTNLFRGITHFGPVENGTYSIKILSPHMLRSVVVPTFQVLDSKRLNILPQVTLLQGDINDDNIVNITDYNLSLGCFQDKKCENKDLIDFNDDGVADVIDYNILLHDYWESQGD